MASEIRIDVVLVEKDNLPIDMNDKKKRGELVSAMQGLQKSEAWQYVRTYFALLLNNTDSALDSVGTPNEALVLAAKRGVVKRILTFPETMIVLAAAHQKQEEINEKKTKEQPNHPMAPRFGGKKEEP